LRGGGAKEERRRKVRGGVRGIEDVPQAIRQKEKGIGAREV